MSVPRFDINGEIGAENVTGAALGRFCDENPGPIEIFINSYGGIASEGAQMFAALERHGLATVIVQGVAASAASLAMLGARKVLISDAALVMLHEPGAMAFGTSGDLRAMASTLEKMTGVYAAIYSRATGNPLSWVEGWMRDETWLTAREAVALNFADGIASAELAPAVAVAAFDYRKFKAAPDELVALSLKNGWTAVPSKQAKMEKTQ